MRLRFPEPGSKLDLLAIPVGILAVGLFGYWFASGALVGRLPAVPSRVTRWFQCGDGTEGQPSWSPDGRWIAYARTGKCGTQIVLVAPNGQREHALTGGRADSEPVWSPHGDQILYDASSGFETVSRSGGRARLVAADDSDLGGGWSPNGRWIVYAHGIASSPLAGTDGTSTIYLLRLQGVRQRIRLVGHSINGGTPSWSPTGRWIATIGWHGIYVISPATHRVVRIVKSDSVPQVTPAWSHDGKRLAYADSDGIYILNSDGSDLHRIIGCDCNGYSDSVSWSPDDRHLAFSQTNDRPSDGIYIVSANGSHLHRIASY